MLNVTYNCSPVKRRGVYVDSWIKSIVTPASKRRLYVCQLVIFGESLCRHCEESIRIPEVLLWMRCPPHSYCPVAQLAATYRLTARSLPNLPSTTIWKTLFRVNDLVDSWLRKEYIKRCDLDRQANCLGLGCQV